ncbi:MAG: ABC transporter substrate-binding protein [Deltaproteobacteria bacterium]|nr:ABC transporter substrate-binding protein [Deltaproteobacteria bacterium]
MVKLLLTFACQNYDHTRALADGSVTLDGVELKCVHISPPSQIFLRMLNQEEFDVSEMSLSNYLIALGNDDKRFIALPVFPSRMFRHSYIWINTHSSIEKPEDLKGKRVGIADYSMTALLFVRGLLQHEYGVAPEDIHWFRRRKEHYAIRYPPGIKIDSIDPENTLDDMLEVGLLDAVALTQPPRGFREGSPQIARLFPDVRGTEALYYRKTKIFPIMHTVVIKRSLYEQNPWLATVLTQALHAAKEQALERLEEGLCPMPWQDLDIEYARKNFGHDIYPYGVKANLPTLEAATLYSYEQGLSPRKFDVAELFAPETLNLLENESD